jgi:serine/threonine protein kinase
MSESAESSTRSGPELARRLGALWDAGQRPDVRHYLAGAGAVSRGDLLAVLLVDQQRRWQAGEAVPAEDYLEQFPALRQAPEDAVELIAGEFRLRQDSGEHPAAGEYQRRFPSWAERLRQRLAAAGPPGDSTATRTRPDPGEMPGTLTTAGTPVFLEPPSWPAPPGYELVRELGRGGMGVVYQVHDRQRRRMVALKTMQGIDPAALWRFKQEFRSLAGLAHPNLVTLYELVGEGARWFFTMELVEGVPFLSHVRAGDDRERAGRERLRDAVRQLTVGLHFLHQAGKVHRDVKPGNVLVTGQGRVVLLDFGLAADLDRAQQHRSVHLLGTAAYMAPEQAACLPVSPAGDWYAVGVMLYEALTGELPFDGAPMEILLRKQREEAPPLAPGPGVPEDLAALAAELLRRRPEDRPPGADILRRLGPPTGAAMPLRPASAPTPDVPLVGRRPHLEALAAALDDVRRGEAVTVLIHGQSGAGKSALLQAFLSGLRERGEAVVLAGRCYEQESVPYKALDSLVDALSRHLEGMPRAAAAALLPRDIAALGRVFPVLHRLPVVSEAPRRGPEVSDPQEVRRRGLAALRELLARLGDRCPLVLAIDDLQWGDLDSAALLGDLLRPPDAPLLLLLVCYRSEDAATSPCLRALLQEPERGGSRRELAVQPLGPQERRELAVTLLGPGAAAAEQVEAIAAQSGGYPFFVQELVQHLHAGGLLAERKSEVDLGAVLWERVCGLPEEARRLLEVVAVAGRPVRQSDACVAGGLGGEERTALLTLRAERMLRTAGPAERNEVETYHDRIRETVVAHLEPDVRRGHHRRLAEVLEGAGPSDPELLASHWQGAGEEARAGHYCGLAAVQASEALAFERAATLFRRALVLGRPAGDEARDLRIRMADALANAGRGADAARVYLEAAVDASAAQALELRRRAALQLLSCGHVDAGLGTLKVVLDEVGLRMPRTDNRALWGLVWQRLRLWLRGLRFTPRPEEKVAAEELRRLDACTAAATGLSMVDTIRGAYFQARSLRLALQAGEPHRLVHALAMEAGHQSIGGSRSRRRTAGLLRRAQAIALTAGDPYSIAMVSLTQGIAAALAGDWREAVEGGTRAEKVLRESCTGVAWELGTAYRFTLWPLMFMGEVTAIARRLPVLLREAQERDDLYTVTNLILVVRTFVRLAADEPGRALVELRQVMDRWSPHGYHVQHMNAWHDEVQIELYGGTAAAAWARLKEAWPAVQDSYFLRVQQVRILLVHLRARCALAAAEGPEAKMLLRSAARDARALRRERVPWATALAKLIEAGLACARGESRAAALFGEAGDLLQGVDMCLYAAAARRRQGELMGGTEGKETKDRAESWMAGQGIRNPERMTALLAPGRAL